MVFNGLLLPFKLWLGLFFPKKWRNSAHSGSTDGTLPELHDVEDDEHDGGRGHEERHDADDVAS
jgi:hypothetical protein